LVNADDFSEVKFPDNWTKFPIDNDASCFTNAIFKSIDLANLTDINVAFNATEVFEGINIPDNVTKISANFGAFNNIHCPFVHLDKTSKLN
jgi:hypothetical protein